jgi:hypothetical protein
MNKNRFWVVTGTLLVVATIWFLSPWQIVKPIGNVRDHLKMELADLALVIKLTLPDAPDTFTGPEIDGRMLREMVRTSTFVPDGKYLMATENGLVDNWGNRIRLALSKDDRGLTVRVWSIGTNCRDEDGHGDDIEASTAYSSAKP